LIYLTTWATEYFGGISISAWIWSGHKCPYYLRLFQNFSFWNSYLEFSGKTGLSAGFSKSLSKTNRVLEQTLLAGYYISSHFLSIYVQHISKKFKGRIAHNVPAVYDVFASPIKETAGFQGLQKCGWRLAWE
jgi:hypothetical protein